MRAESLSWLAPAPLWGQGGISLDGPELAQPFLTELTSDQFVTEFLSLMGAQGGASPTQLGTMAPAVTSDGTATGPYRLFQPLSQRYYLVVASLVCRRVGLPDHAIQPSKGERTTFVMRRLTDGGEEAWVPGPPATPGDPPAGTWQAAPAGQLVAGEEQLPMHATPVAAFAAPGTTAAAFGLSEPGRRAVCYGYIATGRRERMVTALTDSAAVAALQAADPSRQNDPLMSELWARVISPWGALLGQLPAMPPPAKPPAGSDTDYSSLYILLDLGDWLNTYLPTVYQALTGGTTLENGTAAENLRKALAGISVGTRPAPPQQPPPANWTPGAPGFRSPVPGAEGPGWVLRPGHRVRHHRAHHRIRLDGPAHRAPDGPPDGLVRQRPDRGQPGQPGAAGADRGQRPPGGPARALRDDQDRSGRADVRPHPRHLHHPHRVRA